jgi:2-dehydropantoate 2-reductase
MAGGRNMRIGVIGTGAVGGYLGGFLQKAGNEVIFYARGKNLAQMQEKGLTVESSAETFTVGGTFTDNYELFSNLDLVLFCIKSTGTVEVAENLQPFLKNNCMILTPQNGVDNEEILAEYFGKERILSCSAFIQASVKEPGVVQQIGEVPRFIIGALDESRAEKAKEVAELFSAAGIEAFSTTHIREIKWKKLFWNVTFNPLTALLKAKVGAIFEDQDLYQTAVAICREAIAVAQKSGITVDDDYYESILAQGEMAKEHYTSMAQDRLYHKPMELESIAGFIVKKGKQLDVSTPVLETIYRLLKFEQSRDAHA